MRRPVVLALVAVVGLVGCTTGSPPEDEAPAISYATPERLHLAGRDDVPIDGLGTTAPLALVSSEPHPLALAADRLVEVTPDGTRDVLTFDPPVVGAEIGHSTDGTAVTAVTWALGGMEERTRLVWIDGDPELLLDVPGNLPLVGVLAEGIVLRESLGRSRLSVLGWDGTLVGLGIEATDALLVPDTRLMILQRSDEDPMQVVDIDPGAERDVDGLPADARFSQLVASPAASEVAAAIETPAGGDLALWRISAEPLAARRLLPLDDTDVVAGYSDDGRWVVLVTDGTRYGGEVVAVRLDDGEVVTVDLPRDATPRDWSRTPLTLQSLRPQP